jgi:hypothetical protein
VLTCSRCRTPIPGDSTFCPMCGRKAPGLDSFDTLRQELPSTLGEAAQLAAAAAPASFAVPRPSGADPSFVTPTPEPADIAEPPRRTLVLAPVGDAPPPLAAPGAPTMALGAFPASPPRYAPAPPYGYPPPPAYPARPPISGRFRAAGPVHIPITPSPARIAIGVVLAAVALWLALWFLPTYRARLSDEVRSALGVAAGGLGLAAFTLLLTGLLYRAQAEVRCRVCARPVVAWKVAFGHHCPLGPHHARINWFLVVLTTAFWAALVVGGIGLLVRLS